MGKSIACFRFGTEVSGIHWGSWNISLRIRGDSCLCMSHMYSWMGLHALHLFTQFPHVSSGE